jgi:hypothetical protein
MLLLLFKRQKKAMDPRYKVATFSTKTGTSTLRKHLATEHTHDWITTCDEKNINIKAAAHIQELIAEYRNEQHHAGEGRTRVPFSKEAFVDAIMEFIIADDQVNIYGYGYRGLLIIIILSKSLNVIESPKLRNIFLMLRRELKDSDIPGRTTIRKRIMEVVDEYLEQLGREMQVWYIS